MPSKNFLASSISRKALVAGIFIPAAACTSFLFAPPASAQSICTLLPGGIIDCTAPVATPAPGPIPPTSGTIDVTGSADPLTATLADGFVSTGPINLGTVGGGDINIVSSGISTIQSTGPGLVANSSGSINAQVTDVSTAGDSATGILLRAADDIIFTSDGTIATTGANADAVNAEGGSVTLDLSNVSTTGPNAQGVEVGTINGPAVVTFDLINTSGDGSTGAIITSTGDTSLNGNVIRTGGTDAAAFDISNDAAACLVLGAGGCDNTVTVDEVTTDGFGSIGGIVSSAGDTNVTIGVLRTGGDEAAGLSLGASPSSCAVLGTGACDTAFTVNELTTAGDRSPGAVVRGAGDITADVGVLRTNGDEAAGLDLASDPTACAVLGAGGCDTSFSAGELSTTGDGSTGALIRSAGDTNGSIGLLSTQGNDAAGIDIASDPQACVIAGVGACDVTLAADSVSTSGDGAAGVLIDNAGAFTGDFGLISTGGDNSTGLGITQDPAACLAVGPGVCRANVAADRTQTGGDNSPGIVIATPGPVSLDAGSIVTAGASSDGINVSTDTGAQLIAVGPVSVAGAGSDAIVAAAVCADIDITARDDVVSAQGSAIVATSGCGVRVTTLPGASVTGAAAGIDVTSGTGATITLGGLLTASAGPALDIDGAAANVTIAPTGTIAGRIDLTDNADLLTNNGLLAPAGTSDFGLGADLLVNAGTVRVDGTPVLAGLESLANRGSVDFGDGAANDTLSLPGNFTGEAGSRLTIDVAGSVAGTPTDRLVIGGNAGGTTAVSLKLLGGPAVANPAGTVIVDAATAAGGAFTLAGPTRSGLVDFSLRQNGGDTVLLALPNEIALEPLLLSGAGFDFWYQSADAWSESATLRRSNLGSASPRGTSFWVQGYGGSDKRGKMRDIDVFGTTRATNLRYETDRRGVQGGVDFRLGSTAAFGLTGGYQHAGSDFASGTQLDLEGHNIGAYLLHGGAAGFYAELLAKADFFDLRLGNGALFGGGGRIEGKSYGAEGEVGYRLMTGALHIDVNAGLAYVRTDLDPLEASGFRFDFDRAESLRGRIGLRAGGTGSFAPYADVKLLHEFKGDNDTSLASGGFTLDLADHRKGTWFRGEVGLTGAPDRSGGFVSAWAETGDVKGYGLRLGFRF
jgi:hypothetical protein